ncbi:GNAT family N-acetyltransferase [candidate division KSB1 bacterium]|nr:GNAT family N-acetyltransferase [candidate division KSB1 bacterium]
MLIIRKMQTHEIPRVSEILCNSYRWLAQKEGYTQAQLQWLLSNRGSPQTVAVESQKELYLVAIQETVICGMAAIRQNRITKFYVDPRFHRHGIGAVLFQAAEDQIYQHNHQTLILGATDTAIPFYQKMGLEQIDREPYQNHIFPGRMVAIMRKKL